MKARRYFYNVVLTYEGDECLHWPFMKTEQGYGQIKFDKRTYLTHRLVCQNAHGPSTPERNHAAHSCGKRDCVNYRHLSWKTPQENSDDRIIHGTTNRGERNGKAILTAEDVREIRRCQRKVFQRVLAQRYGVAPGTIACIMARRIWKHV